MKFKLRWLIFTVIALAYLPLCQAEQGKAANTTVVTREGTDVSGYQGVVDWQKVKASGIEFVMLRCGYRGPNDEELCQDTYFESNLKGALDAGLDVGVYYVTQAITTKEAVEEADATLQMVRSVLSQNANYELTLPIAIDFEENDSFRMGKANLTTEQRTAIAQAFCSRIEANGYTAMYYAGKNYLDTKLSANTLTGQYPLWYAHYTPNLSNGTATIWQYSNQGSIPGIIGNADLNRQYIRTPDQVKNMKASLTNAMKVSLSWSKGCGVYGYEIYRTSSKDNKETLLTTVKGAGRCTYTDSSVQKGVTYSYRVRAILKTNAKKYYGKASSSVKSVVNSYRITLKTNGGTIKKGNVTQYQYGQKVTLPTKVERKGYLFGGWYTNSKCTKGKTTAITSGATGNKTYYAKWIKVSVSKPILSSVKNLKGKKMVLKLKSKVSNADGYQVQYSKKSSMKSSKTDTLKKGTTTSITISSLSKGKYYVRVRAYRVDSTRNKVYGSWSSQKSVSINK